MSKSHDRGRAHTNTDGNSISHSLSIDPDAMSLAGRVHKALPALAAEARRANVATPVKAKRTRRVPEPWEFTDENPES